MQDHPPKSGIFATMLNRMIKGGMLLGTAVFLASCGTVLVYKAPDEPVMLCSEPVRLQDAGSSTLTVLSFNIEKSEKIRQAISELKDLEKTMPVDVYLLQEMSEDGVQAIARELNLNYLYIPIVYNRLLKKDIGNAILSRGMIAQPEKLILPHQKWVNGRWRHATVGEVQFPKGKILVYSVHTETSTMGRRKRMEQLDAIIGHAASQSGRYDRVVIGGDFNTLFPRDAGEAVQKFEAAGFHWATAEAGHTARAVWGIVRPRADYIFCKGMEKAGGGKIEESMASDHYPVYAVFREAANP